MNILANIGGLFGGDGLVIFLVMLLLFGAKKLPELARGLGSAIREFSKAKDEIEHEITRAPVTPPVQIETPLHTEPHITGASPVVEMAPEEPRVSVHHEEPQGVPAPVAMTIPSPVAASTPVTTHHSA